MNKEKDDEIEDVKMNKEDKQKDEKMNKEDKQKDEKMIVQDIPLDMLKDNPYDTRKKVGDIENLAKSIEKRGLQNPISVVKAEDNFYYIVHGHRRSYAYRFLKRETIPAIVRKDSTTAGLMLDLAIENLQRKDLSPVEKGEIIEKLVYQEIPSVKNIENVLSIINQVKFNKDKDRIEEGTGGAGFNKEDIDKAEEMLNIIGIHPNTAHVYVKLLLLPKEIQENVATVVKTVPEGKIGVKVAHELTRIKDPEIQKELSEKAIKDKITYMQMKNVVDKIIDDDSDIARKSITSSSERRTEDDVGATKLTEDLFMLSSKIDGFRSKLPLVQGRLDKAQWIASMERMKKSCMDMVKNINNLVHEDLKFEERLEYVNLDLEVEVTKEHRYHLPRKSIELLDVKEGDVLLLQIGGVKKIPKPKLIDLGKDLK